MLACVAARNRVLSCTNAEPKLARAIRSAGRELAVFLFWVTLTSDIAEYFVRGSAKVAGLSLKGRFIFAGNYS